MPHLGSPDLAFLGTLATENEVPLMLYTQGEGGCYLKKYAYENGTGSYCKAAFAGIVARKFLETRPERFYNSEYLRILPDISHLLC